MRELTEKQSRFIDEYIIDCNASAAARRAGYSEKTAYSSGNRLMKTKLVQEEIARRMKEKKSELIAQQDEVLEFLTATMRGDKQAFYSRVARDNGEETTQTIAEGEKTPHIEERVRAAELLGKRYGLFTERLEASVDSVVSFVDDIGEGYDND